jgi:AraC-like DNA-binding protein
MMRFSTDAFPERERLSAWREIFGRGIAKVDIAPQEGVEFYAHLRILAMPNFVLASGEGAWGKSTRTRGLVADGNDALALQISSCDGIASQLGREVAVPAGDAVVLSNGDVGTYTYGSASAGFVLGLPRASLGPFLRDPDAALVRPIPKENAALRLLRGYVGALERERPARADLQALAVAHVNDLVALTLGATRDAAETARTRGLRAARLHAARAFMMRHLDNAGLSVASVASHLGVSPRYVHMLFAATDMSFSEFVLTQRLARAHRMLASPHHVGDTISTIAFAVGFADLSHFNRTFRHRYGCTPSDVRTMAERDYDGR